MTITTNWTLSPMKKHPMLNQSPRCLYPFPSYPKVMITLNSHRNVRLILLHSSNFANSNYLVKKKATPWVKGLI